MNTPPSPNPAPRTAALREIEEVLICHANFGRGKEITAAVAEKILNKIAPVLSPAPTLADAAARECAELTTMPNHYRSDFAAIILRHLSGHQQAAGVEELAIFKLCHKCNKEFELELGTDNAGTTSTFQKCPHCGVRNDTWFYAPLRPARYREWHKESVKAIVVPASSPRGPSNKFSSNPNDHGMVPTGDVAGMPGMATWSSPREAIERARHELEQARQKYQDGFECVPFCELADAIEALLTAIAPHLSPATEAPHGTLTRAGTFPVRDEEVTGYLITCTEEEIKQVKHLPMYRRVVIVEEAHDKRSDGERSDKERLDCHGLDTPERVCFYEQDFYPLSNFSAFPIQWKGHWFNTSEEAYHWEKFPEAGSFCELIESRQFSAHHVFKMAEKRKIARRPDWDAVKVGIMRDILRAKVEQHDYVRRKLLATGDRELVENSWRDDFWGWGANRDGQNMLGKLWMEIRTEQRAALAAQTDTRK